MDSNEEETELREMMLSNNKKKLLQKIREGYNYKQLIVLLNKNENQLRKKLFCNFGTGKLEEVRKQLEME